MPSDQELLIAAAAKGDEEEVSSLLAKGVDPNGVNERGQTALMEAASRGHTGTMLLLIPHTNLEACDQHGNTALRLASNAAVHHPYHSPFWDACHLLVEAGASFNFSLYESRISLLHICADVNKLSLVNLLLAKGANANYMDSAGDTALHSAVREGHLKIVKRLIPHTNLDLAARDSAKPLETAAARGHWKICKLLIEAGASIDPDVVFYFVDGNQPDLLQSALEKGFDCNSTNYDGQTPLIRAIELRRLQIAQLLIPHTNLDIRCGLTALESAALSGHDNIVCQLLEAGASPAAEPNQDSILHFLAHKNKPDLIQLALEKGANPNHVNNNGETALMVAACWGIVETTQLLIQHTNLEVVNNYGETALRQAVRYGEEWVWADSYTRTLILSEVRDNEKPVWEACRLLINAGASCENVDLSGIDLSTVSFAGHSVLPAVDQKTRVLPANWLATAIRKESDVLKTDICDLLRSAVWDTQIRFFPSAIVDTLPPDAAQQTQLRFDGVPQSEIDNLCQSIDPREARLLKTLLNVPPLMLQYNQTFER